MTTSALNSRNFLIYLCGTTVSLHGLWIYRVALGWYAWEITGSEFWVGIIAFTQFAPAVVFGPLFGVLADRFERRKASVLINSLSVMNMMLLSSLTGLGQVDIVVLALSALMQGTLDGAHTPVRMTIVPNLVTRAQLQSAIASSSIAFNVSRLIGPALAGIIIASYGVGTAFFINGVSYIAVVTVVMIVRLNPSATRSEAPKDLWSELMDGVRYVMCHATIRALLWIVLIAAVLGRGALEMLPAFADGIYGRGSAGLAILTSAIGAGAIVIGVVLARGTAWLNVRATRISLIVSGIVIALLGWNNDFTIAVGLVALLGIILSLVGVGSQILIQSTVEDEVRGRVSSLWGMLAFGGTAIGSLIIGFVADAYGLQITTIVTGLSCTVLAILSGARFSSR